MNFKKDYVCLIVVWFIIAAQMSLGVCLECYSCSNTSSMALCQSVVTCAPGHTCFKKVNAGAYTLGCGRNATCKAVGSGSGGTAWVGRRSVTSASRSVTSASRSVTSASRSVTTTNDFSECCHTSMCNKQLCQTQYPSCHDSGAFNCQTTRSLLYLCKDTSHAAKQCKKFCGLCAMVDGGWTAWSAWSPCSTTCSNGTETRTRSCTNPVPANGGANCAGTDNDTRVCTHSPCPVNGGWGGWTSWGACSVSCGVGLKRRTRTCSQPTPAHCGSICPGDVTDVTTCTTAACTDGSWVTWGAWSACIASCGDCIHKRHRSCTGHAVGKVCIGDNFDVKISHQKACGGQTPAVAGPTTAHPAPRCQDLDTGGCKLFQLSNPNLCSDPVYANNHCKRLCGNCPAVAGPTIAQPAPSCQDLDTGGCKLFQLSNPNLCSDPVYANNHCKRLCGNCPIECYHCPNAVLDPTDCNTTALCAPNQTCTTKHYSASDGHHEFILTCGTTQMCNSLSFGSGKRHAARSDVTIHHAARSDVTLDHDEGRREKRDIILSCCDTDLCNLPLATDSTTRAAPLSSTGARH